MSDTDFSMMADDGPEDLPRTLRREKEAREREKREREEKARKATLTHDFGASDAPYAPAYEGKAAALAAPATVTRLNVPFFHLMGFFIKAVLAAIPALVLLGVLLWGAGALLKTYYPQLVHTEIIIRVPR